MDDRDHGVRRGAGPSRRLRTASRRDAVPLPASRVDRASVSTPAGDLAPGHGAASAVQRERRGRAPDRRGRGAGVSGGPTADPGPRRFHGRHPTTRHRPGARVAGTRHRHRGPYPRLARGLQGRGAGSRTRRGDGRVDRDLRRRLRASAGFPRADGAALHRPAGGHGAGALEPPQSGSIAVDRRAGRAARRSLRPRTRGAHGRGTVLQFQRHRRHVAARVHRRRRTLVGRHADRRPRPELSGPVAGLEFSLRFGDRGACRVAGGRSRVQVAATTVGAGLDPDGAQDPAAPRPVRPVPGRQARGRASPDVEPRVPAAPPLRGAAAFRPTRAAPRLPRNRVRLRRRDHCRGRSPHPALPGGRAGCARLARRADDRRRVRRTVGRGGAGGEQHGRGDRGAARPAGSVGANREDRRRRGTRGAPCLRVADRSWSELGSALRTGVRAAGRAGLARGARSTGAVPVAAGHRTGRGRGSLATRRRPADPRRRSPRGLRAARGCDRGDARNPGRGAPRRAATAIRSDHARRPE